MSKKMKFKKFQNTQKTFREFSKYTLKLYSRNKDDYQEIGVGGFVLRFNSKDGTSLYLETVKSNGVTIEDLTDQEIKTMVEDLVTGKDNQIGESFLNLWKEILKIHIDPDPTSKKRGEIIQILGKCTTYPFVIEDPYGGRTVGCLYKGDYLVSRSSGEEKSPYDKIFPKVYEKLSNISKN